MDIDIKPQIIIKTLYDPVIKKDEKRDKDEVNSEIIVHQRG